MAANLPSPDPGEPPQARPGDTITGKIAAFTARHILGRRNGSMIEESMAAPPAAEVESRGFARLREVDSSTDRSLESQHSLTLLTHLSPQQIQEIVDHRERPSSLWDVVLTENNSGDAAVAYIRDRWGNSVWYDYCPPTPSPPRQTISLRGDYSTDWQREYQGSPRYYEQLAALENNTSFEQEEAQLREYDYKPAVDNTVVITKSGKTRKRRDLLL